MVFIPILICQRGHFIGYFEEENSEVKMSGVEGGENGEAGYRNTSYEIPENTGSIALITCIFIEREG